MCHRFAEHAPAAHPGSTACRRIRHPTGARDECASRPAWRLDRMARAVAGDDDGGMHRTDDHAPPARARQLVRVVVVDDHAAIRMGLQAAIASRPPLVCAGAAACGEELAPLLYRTRPDVVVLDYDLPRVNGLELCRRIKAEVPAPAVLVYSAYADATLALAASIAGAGGIVHKGAPA